MNNTGNHNTAWSDDDIRKYLEGKLSAPEMHRLEKAALDDPFLADALEGLAAAPHPGKDLDDLNIRLAARVEEPEKRSGLVFLSRPAFRVAAAIILLAGLCFTAYYVLLEKKAPENPIVRNTPPPPVPTQPPAVTADTTAVAAYTANEPRQHKAASPTVARRAAPAAARDYADAEKKAADADDKLLAKTDTTASTAGITLPVPDSILMSNSRTASIAPVADYRSLQKAAAFSSSPLVFSGRVVDTHNRPLPGAIILIKGSPTIGATTDAQGTFNFRLPARDTTQHMIVSLAGYQPASLALRTDVLANNLIRLQQDKPALSEVVVTGYGSKRRETLAAPPSESDERLDSVWIRVYPVPGRLAYLQYLDEAKKTLTLDTTIRGTERISFEVDQKGLLSDFKIEQSLSPAHDAGLIQLIEGGPRWRLLHGKKARAIVSLAFP